MKGARDADDKQKERWAEVVVAGGTDDCSTTCDERRRWLRVTRRSMLKQARRQVLHSLLSVFLEHHRAAIEQQLLEASELLGECDGEHAHQAAVLRNNGRKSKDNNGAKAQLQAIQDRAPNIVEQVLPHIGECFAEFCKTTGNGQSRFTLDFVADFVEGIVLTRLQPLRLVMYDANDGWDPSRMIVEHVAALWQTWLSQALAKTLQ